MTNLFNAEKAITSVWEKVDYLNGIIAGGIVTDYYMGKGASDIDVFVSCANIDAVMDFVEENKFKPAGNDRNMGTVNTDSYGRQMNRSRNTIHRVYKGFVLGYPVDIVLVTEHNVLEHLDTFDLNIKRAWYDGRFRYSETFMKDITNNTITANRYEPIGYIRALKAAQKYDMEISPQFELSRNYVAYLKKHGLTHRIPTKYHSFVEENDFGKHELYKVQAADLFTYLYNERNVSIKELASLSNMMKRSIQTHHPITRETLTVETPSDSYDVFRSMAHKVYEILYTNDADPTLRADITPLFMLSYSDFMDGQLTMYTSHDPFKRRTMRINKYINRMMKQFPEMKMSFEMMMKVVETRSTTSSMTVEFSASTKDLLEISTRKGWRSCQAWSFGHADGFNSKVLGNLGGATVVGIFRSNDSDKWAGRFLVRLGEDNALFLEGIYSHRTELNTDHTMILNQVADTLRDRGYTVMMNPYSPVQFRSLPMVFEPYNDCSLQVSRDQDSNDWKFMTRRPLPQKRNTSIFAMPVVRDIAGQIHVPGADNDGDGMIRVPAVPQEIRAGRVAARQGLVLGQDVDGEDPFADPRAVVIEDGDDLPF